MPSPSAAGFFPRRRELRLQREVAERAAELAAAEQTASQAPVESETPRIPLAPAPVIADTVAEPEALAPRRTRSTKRRPGGRRVDSARRRTVRQRITGTATMMVVGGIFASLTLPAYAFSGAATDATPILGDTATQSLQVETKASPATARDAFSATSASDLRAIYAAQLRAANGTLYSRSMARALGDDYPWYDMGSRSQGGGLSPLRYYYRECVDFVAWRLNRDAGYTTAPFKWDWSTLTPGGGNASQWKSAWQDHGWATGTTPVAGSVAWFTTNHVAYVKSVLPDGSVLLEEYNYDNDHAYDQRIVGASDVALYLYAPPK